MGCHALLQEMFLTQESNLCLLSLLHWKVLYHQQHLGSPGYDTIESKEGEPWRPHDEILPWSPLPVFRGLRSTGHLVGTSGQFLYYILSWSLHPSLEMNTTGRRHCFLGRHCFFSHCSLEKKEHLLGKDHTINSYFYQE